MDFKEFLRVISPAVDEYAAVSGSGQIYAYTKGQHKVALRKCFDAVSQYFSMEKPNTRTANWYANKYAMLLDIAYYGNMPCSINIMASPTTINMAISRRSGAPLYHVLCNSINYAVTENAQFQNILK